LSQFGHGSIASVSFEPGPGRILQNSSISAVAQVIVGGSLDSWHERKWMFASFCSRPGRGSCRSPWLLALLGFRLAVWRIPFHHQGVLGIRGGTALCTVSCSAATTPTRARLVTLQLADGTSPAVPVHCDSGARKRAVHPRVVVVHVC